MDAEAFTTSSSITPDSDAEEAELRRPIHRAVMELPDRQRDVVILQLLEKRSTRQTAEVLGCAEGTVKAALHQAVKKWRQSMEVWVR